MQNKLFKYLEAENKQDLIGDNFIGLVDFL